MVRLVGILKDSIFLCLVSDDGGRLHLPVHPPLHAQRRGREPHRPHAGRLHLHRVPLPQASPPRRAFLSNLLYYRYEDVYVLACSSGVKTCLSDQDWFVLDQTTFVCPGLVCVCDQD